MTDTETSRVAIDWIRYHVAQRNSQEQFDTAWADTKVLDLFLDERFEDAWQMILAIYSLDQSVPILVMLSAGPIEDLLSYKGASFIDRIEEKAKDDPVFANALVGVWQNNMSDDVWARLQVVADPIGWNEMCEHYEPCNLPWALRPQK